MDILPIIFSTDGIKGTTGGKVWVSLQFPPPPRLKLKRSQKCNQNKYIYYQSTAVYYQNGGYQPKAKKGEGLTQGG